MGWDRGATSAWWLPPYGRVAKGARPRTSTNHVLNRYQTRSQTDIEGMAPYGDIGKEALVPVEILRLAEAARRLSVPTLEIVQIVTRRQIDYVLVDGVPRIPETVVDEMKGRRAAS